MGQSQKQVNVKKKIFFHGLVKKLTACLGKKITFQFDFKVPLPEIVFYLGATVGIATARCGVSE